MLIIILSQTVKSSPPTDDRQTDGQSVCSSDKPGSTSSRCGAASVWDPAVDLWTSDRDTCWHTGRQRLVHSSWPGRTVCLPLKTTTTTTHSTQHLATTSGFVLDDVTLISLYQHTKCRRGILIHGWDVTTSGFEKQTSAILEFFFPLWFWPDCSNLHAILNQVVKFRPNHATHGGVMTSYTISRWRPRRLHTTSSFRFDDVTLFRRSTSTSISKPNFTDISRTAELQLLPVCKNNRPPCWNSTSGFDFDHITVLGKPTFVT